MIGHVHLLDATFNGLSTPVTPDPAFYVKFHETHHYECLGLRLGEE